MDQFKSVLKYFIQSTLLSGEVSKSDGANACGAIVAGPELTPIRIRRCTMGKPYFVCEDSRDNQGMMITLYFIILSNRFN